MKKQDLLSPERYSAAINVYLKYDISIRHFNDETAPEINVRIGNEDFKKIKILNSYSVKEDRELTCYR